MKSIHLIAHCWAGDRSCYAKMLTAQLSALLRWPPKARVLLSICTNECDKATLLAIESFHSRGVPVEPILLPKPQIFRRAIGRNVASKASKADIVWFTDCDLIFGDSCLDTLSLIDFSGLAYPTRQMIHRSHALGDEDLATITIGEPWQIDIAHFVPHRMRFASGGVQIVDGETGRKGYLDGSKWTRQADPERGFCDPGEDRVYRGLFTNSTPLSLPNLFRFRHSDCPFEKAEDRLAQTSHVR